MLRTNISDRQKVLLERARNGSPDDLWRSFLYLDEVADEVLDPEWRDIWDKSHLEIRKYLPEEIFGRIDEVIAKVPVHRIDPNVSDLQLDRTDKVCFLLGAGASAPAPSSIPTTAQLLPELWRRARKLGRDDIDNLVQWCEGHNIKNIEDLLTAAYLANFAAKNAGIPGLLDYFLFRPKDTETAALHTRVTGAVDTASIALLQDTLQTLFGLLTSTMIPAPPNEGHQAIADFASRHHQTSIVTTNYDGCIDEALTERKIPVATLIEESPGSGAGVRLIKMHGSINWSYCDSCHQVREYELPLLKKTYANDTLSYAVIGICKRCGGQRRPLLIPPIGLKFVMFPNLIRLWHAARETVERAKLIVVVGYSFSEADAYINKIIEGSMSVHSQQNLIVCDCNPQVGNALRSRLSRFEGFDPSRVLHATGSAAEILPELLSHLPYKPVEVGG